MFQLEAEVREKKGSKTLEDAARAPTLMTNAEDAAQEDAQAGSGSAAAVASSAAAPSDTAAKRERGQKEGWKGQKSEGQQREREERKQQGAAQPCGLHVEARQEGEKGEGRKEEAARVRRV